MAQLPFIAAIDAGIHQEMRRDPSVLYFGQNMATTENHDFVAAYGHDRVRVTPISETAEIGMAIGAAMAGLRPVVELYMAEFMLVAMDQVVNEAPRFRYMSGGQVKVPLVLKAGFGFACGWAGQHTGSLTALFMGVPGLKVVRPLHGGGCQGADGHRDPRRQSRRVPAPLSAHARTGRGARRRVSGAVRPGRNAPYGRRRHPRRDRLDGAAVARGGEEARRRRDPGGGHRPAHRRAARPRRRS